MDTLVTQEDKNRPPVRIQPKKAVLTMVFSGLEAWERAKNFAQAIEQWYQEWRAMSLAVTDYYRYGQGYIVTVEIDDGDYSYLLGFAEKWCREQKLELFFQSS